MKIMTIVGARPQFVKASVLSREIAALNKAISQTLSEVMVHTGQHFDHNMSASFFDDLAIPAPKYNLNINQGSHGAMTGLMLQGIEPLMVEESPDVVLVYGDTNSTLAGALAASKLHIPVAHVEAGLRSGNKRMPEEINRICADHVSKWLFCPTKTAVSNLAAENLHQGVYAVGDIMYDAYLYACDNGSDLHSLPDQLSALLNAPFVLATLHRAENTDSKERLCKALAALNQFSCEMPVVLPLHPRTRQKISQFGLHNELTNLTIIEPQGYNQMMVLLSHCNRVVTDSGGLQKEAYFAKVPCITLRDETEWVETVECGWNTLVNVETDDIVTRIGKAIAPDNWAPIYGNGYTGRRIIEILLQQY